MKDRIPLNPGRVRLTPVAGETDLFDMEMADNPTELGTALNKANLLTDATAAAIAAAFGSTPDTPNEALALLAGCANIETQSYIGTGTSGSSHPNTLTLAHEPKLVIISGENGLGGYDSVALVWTHMGATGIFVGWRSGGRDYNNYTLTNNRKTITWYAESDSSQVQLNILNTTYAVISFY